MSPFNDRFRSDCYTYRHKKGGVELYFNSKSSTFKVYDKLREIKNNAITKEEMAIVKALQPSENGQWICENLRTELTLKDSTSIRKRLKPYMKSEPTFSKIFKEYLWDELLRNETIKAFNHPLKEFVFLSSIQANAIQALLDINIKHLTTKLQVKDMIEKIQREGGTKGVRKYYEQAYKSRQTYYNHLKKLEKILANIDLNHQETLTSRRFHDFYLRSLGIKNEPPPNTLF